MWCKSMAKTAFVFPGVGVRLCGRESDFLNANRVIASPFFEAASAKAGLDLEQALQSGDLESLSEEQQQLFTFAFSVTAARCYTEAGSPPFCVAGYSFGVYAALYIAGTISFDEGLEILSAAYGLMREECADRQYDMGVVVGLLRNEVKTILKDPALAQLSLANSNNETCHIVSGSSKLVTRFLKKTTDADAISAQTLGVSVPYHNRHILMPASERFAKKLADFHWKNTQVPIISTIDQQSILEIDQVIEYIAQNLSQPISWHDTIDCIEKMNIGRFAECGPGISLTQNGRFSNQQTAYINIKNYLRKL
jgi:[acyl-carrier-protein] S-malonyltransferase